ncbi:MAG: hypothetical protein HY425_02220 [Candidatus Levybacteria bacterium]|nr:hypothetical protein [Candidatus Levybacteria bacterium]
METLKFPFGRKEVRERLPQANGGEFVNNYKGEGANFEESLQFNSRAIEAFLKWMNFKGQLILTPMTDSVKNNNKNRGGMDAHQEFVINKSPQSNIISIHIDGRAISQSQFNKGIKDSAQMRSAFVKDFNSVLKTALHSLYEKEDIFNIGTEECKSFLFLKTRGRMLVGEKGQ